MARSLLLQKNINQQGFKGAGSTFDFSVNSAATDLFSKDKFINLRTGGATGFPRPLGAFTGGGIGNKAIYGVQGLSGASLSELKNISFTWENVTGLGGPNYIPPTAGTVLTPYVNLIVNFGGTLRILVLISDSLNPTISNSIGTYSNNGSNVLTFSWNSTMNILIVNSPPTPAPGGILPVITTGPLWLNNAYSFAELIAANPAAMCPDLLCADLVDDFPNDGGLPAGAILPSLLLISGDSGNLTRSGKKITSFKLNGQSVLPF